jgi:hypothetical protein
LVKTHINYLTKSFRRFVKTHRKEESAELPLMPFFLKAGKNISSGFPVGIFLQALME